MIVGRRILLKRRRVSLLRFSISIGFRIDQESLRKRIKSNQRQQNNQKRNPKSQYFQKQPINKDRNKANNPSTSTSPTPLSNPLPLPNPPACPPPYANNTNSSTPHLSPTTSNPPSSGPTPETQHIYLKSSFRIIAALRWWRIVSPEWGIGVGAQEVGRVCRVRYHYLRQKRLSLCL